MALAAFTSSTVEEVASIATGAKLASVGGGLPPVIRGLTRKVPVEPSTSEYPSAGDLATCSLPMAPPAPPRFSTTTDWPSRLARVSENRRPVMSAFPPGAKGTSPLAERRPPRPNTKLAGDPPKPIVVAE
jgi:hypothetical protein